MNDRTTGRIHSFYEAPNVAMEMIEGLHPTAFYDDIKMRGKMSQMLNYKGISLLAGLMGCHVISIEETDESDAKQLVLKAVAENPMGHKGYGWISRPKQTLKEEDDEDYRERSYVHVKRNALRDLVPWQVFLEMLLRQADINAKGAKQQPKQQPKQQQAPPTAKQQAAKPALPALSAEQKELEQLKQGARDTIGDERENLKHLHGLTAPEVIAQCEENWDVKQKDWNKEHWAKFILSLKDPVAHGIDTANEQSDDDSGGIEQEPSILNPEELADLAKSTTESADDDALQQVMNEIGN